MAKRKINVQGISIKLEIGDNDFISITDIAKNFGRPTEIIRNWLRNSNT